MRSYIGYEVREDREDYLSVFLGGRFDPADNSRVEIWSNLARLSSEGVEYWYGFVQYDYGIFDQLTMGTKVALRYSRTKEDKFQPTLAIELTALL